LKHINFIVSSNGFKMFFVVVEHDTLLMVENTLKWVCLKRSAY
jgi:hypothetical protein